MNKLSKIFLGIIIILVIALGIMTYLYFNMRTIAKNNLNNLLEECEEKWELYHKLQELEGN